MVPLTSQGKTDINELFYLFNPRWVIPKVAYYLAHGIITVVLFVMSNAKLSIIEKYCNWALTERYFCELC